MVGGEAVSGENFTHVDRVNGEGWTVTGAGARCGAGVKCGMERQGMAGGGIRGDSDLWDPRAWQGM